MAILAWRYSSSWKFEDKNNSTFNIAEKDLVNSQEDYFLPVTAFDVERVEILDKEGNYYKLEFLKDTDIKEAIPEFQETDGKPMYYLLRGHSIILKPAPDTNLVSKIRLYLAKDINEFSYSDTTKEPGIPSVLHPIIPYEIAFEIAGINSLPQLAYLDKKVDEWKKIFIEYFAERAEEKVVRLKPKYNNFE